MDVRLILLHLSLIPSVGSATIRKLVQLFSLERLSELYSTTQSQLLSLGIPLLTARAIVEGLAQDTLLNQELMLLQKHDISWLTLYDAGYPGNLKEIHVPPMIVYVQGETLASYARSIAIVGSRKADNYGAQAIKTVVPELIQDGWTIVSGGALGIDTLAHHETIEAQGKTIAVLGSGLLKWYPSSNKKLFERIVQSGGSLVSPFGLNVSALAGNFPARNRIIAGLSRGCIVIQAAQKSGALITAQFALNEGREVFAVPGAIHNPLSVGCHELIKQGAQLVQSAADVIAAFEPSGKMYQQTLDHALHEKSKPEQTSASLGNSEELVVEKPIHAKIVRALAQPLSFDELLLKTSCSPEELQDELWNLSLEGQIAQNMLGFWQRA